MSTADSAQIFRPRFPHISRAVCFASAALVCLPGWAQTPAALHNLGGPSALAITSSTPSDLGAAAYIAGAAPDVNAVRPSAERSSAAQALPIANLSAGNGELRFHGITFYGTIDIGAQHQTHGATYSSDAPPTGLEQLISKNSNHALTHYSQNGLNQSVLGVRGDEKISGPVSFIFKLEPGVEPLDLKFTNALQSVVNDNGVAQQNQAAEYDSSRAGRIDNGEAYFGLAVTGENRSAKLTFGRVTSLMAEDVPKYDFEAGAYAFSLVGFVGSVAGAGDTEDSRLDSTLKFSGQLGRYRVAALTQLSGHNAAFQPDGVYGSNKQVLLGTDIKRFSVDVIYAAVHDAISAAPLSAAQVATLPANSVAATISDNAAFGVVAKYSIDRSGRLKVYSGYDRIRYANPYLPLSAGVTTVGGYTLSALTQNAYIYRKILDASWAGAKYALTRRLDLSGGFYTYRQNSYSGNGCADNSNSKCSGSLKLVSAVAAYKISRRLGVYGGGEWSDVTNGYSSGYLYTTTAIAVLGGQLRF